MGLCCDLLRFVSTICCFRYCSKYLDVKVYTHLTKTIVKLTQLCTVDDHIVTREMKLRVIFDAVNEAFVNIHQMISHTNKIDSTTREKAELAINHYMIQKTLSQQLHSKATFLGKALHPFH